MFSGGSPALSHVDSVEIYPEEAADMTRSLTVATPKCTGVLTPSVSCTDEVTFTFPTDLNKITEGMILYDHRTHDIIYLLELDNPGRASYKTIRNSDTSKLTDEPGNYTSLDNLEGERRVAIAINRNAHPESKDILNTLRTLRDDFKKRDDNYTAKSDALDSDIDELLKDIERNCRQAQRSLRTGQFMGCLELNPARADELNGREADLLDRQAELQNMLRKVAQARNDFRDYANNIRQSSPVYKEVPATPSQAGSSEVSGTEAIPTVPVPTSLPIYAPTPMPVHTPTTITGPEARPTPTANLGCPYSGGFWFMEDYWKEVDAPTLHRDLYCGERDVTPYIDIEGVGEGFGRTPLHLAAWHSESPEVIQTLLDYGSDVDARAEHDLTPVHFAAWHSSSPEIIQLLLDYGSNIEAKATFDRTPLHYASFYNNVEAAQVLIANGVNIEARDVSGSTPLRSATPYCHFEVIQLLLEKGANIWAEDEYDNTPLDVANECETPVLEMLHSYAERDTR